MKTFDSFLNPKPKENLRFTLSDRFTDENGNLLEWEMRSLTAAEGIELSRDSNGNMIEVMANYVANALVEPNLKSKDNLDALSKREGRTILNPMDALKCLVTDAELNRLIMLYNNHNAISADSFEKKIVEAKN